MKSSFLRLALIGALMLATSTLRAEDWKTNDGKVYQDVQVIRVETDAVTILHHDGGGRIPLANLPAPLQTRFHYDPARAKLAAAARATDDAENAKALQVEMDQAAAMGSLQYDLADPAHHSVDALTASAAAMRRDLADPSYHTMAHLALSMGSLDAAPEANHHSMSEIDGL